MLIDTHAHLMFPEFRDDLEAVLARARAAGLEKIINIGCGVESSRQALEIAKDDELKGGNFLYATLGLHPYEALDISDELLVEWKKWILADQEVGKSKSSGKSVNKIIGIGEIGLDYVKSTVDKAKQKYVFRRQLELAVTVGLPVIVHNRGADEDCLELLKEFGRDGAGFQQLVRDCGCDDLTIEPVRAVFHCFGSTLEFAKQVWECGFFTSFTGIITYPSAKDLRDVVKQAPMEKLMVETDCPYLAPQAYRGKRNEPAYVVETAKMIAELKGMDLEQLSEIAVRNTLNFFAL